MYKAIRDDKIIAINDSKIFPLLVYDSIEQDTEHTTADYDQYNGEYMLKEEIPIPTNEEQAEKRRQAYVAEVDTLHAQKLRHIVIGDWTEEDEANYVAEVKRLSEDINNRFPYMENEEQELLTQE